MSRRSIPPRGNPEKSVFGVLGASLSADDGNFYVKIENDSRNIGWGYVGNDNSTVMPTPTPIPSTTPVPTPTITPTQTPSLSWSS